ncbi:MAG TPA: hypothetical protein VFZ32_02710 [Micromonosporaceae bacterium]
MSLRREPGDRRVGTGRTPATRPRPDREPAPHPFGVVATALGVLVGTLLITAAATGLI